MMEAPEIDPAVSESSPPDAPDTAPVPTCSHCGAELADNSLAICRRCGYYPRLGMCVEVDPNFEIDFENEEHAITPGTAPTPSWREWIGKIPRWVYVVLVLNGLVVAESFAATRLLEEGATARMIWSLAQLFVALAVLAVAHFLAYFTAVMQTDNVTLVDIFVRPLAIWIPVIRLLPRTWKRISAATMAITALGMSFLVIGSLPYERLWDWGVKPPPKMNLIGAVVEQARKARAKEQDLEDSLAELTRNVPQEETKKSEVLPTKREELDCVIVGYLPVKDDLTQFASLVLATLVGGKLKVVGVVSAGIPPETHEEIRARLSTLVIPRPIVDSTLPAVWVEPVLACRVSCLQIASGGQLIDTRFEGSLADIPLSP